MDIFIEEPKITSSPTFLSYTQTRINNFLDQQLIIPNKGYDNLMQAIRYSTLKNGKRIRAALIYALELELSVNPIICDHIAASIECMHASSLIHDDLPALDNDSIRRGQPSCHVKHGEAIAILAGDALLNLSHQMITSIPTDILSSETIVNLLQKLGQTIGTQGMIGGQAMEFSTNTNSMSLQDIKDLYSLKTAALIGCGIEMAVLASGQCNHHLLQEFAEFSLHLGLAFQIKDDILDIESNTHILGKPQFSDLHQQKQTLTSLIGVSEAKKHLAQHHHQAITHLKKTALTLTTLHKLVDYMFSRNY